MTNLCWIRRDLRLDDHFALSQSLKNGKTLLVFIFDPNILDSLKNKEDQRISFIIDSLKEMEVELNKIGSSICIRYGDPVKVIPELAREWEVKAVYCNRDYGPYAKERDQKVAQELKKNEVDFLQYKDAVIFEKHEVLTKTQGVFKVFTPYKNRWMEILESSDLENQVFPCNKKQFLSWKNSESILKRDWYKVIGFTPKPPSLTAGRKEGMRRLKNFAKSLPHYQEHRNFPAIDGTSLLSVYIRHGNISIREMVKLARGIGAEGQTWLNELIWRDFFQMILDAYPRVTKGSFRPEYDQIEYPGTNTQFLRWCKGETGFPLVDAAMRCLNETGLMHNRLRMLCASFLCKTLLVDWRKGEKYFAEKLLDFDLAANNGGWQWSASTGCDAQPYFRIFNPYTQSEKFDPDGEFIRKWVPELAHLNGKEIHHPDHAKVPEYPAPIVSYSLNRLRCLKMYETIKKA